MGVTHIQCQHLIPVLNTWAAMGNSQPLIQLPPSFLGMDNHTMELSFDSLAAWVIDVLELLFFDMLSMGV